MNKTGIVLIIALAMLFQIDPSATRAQSSSKTVVYYFHGQYRCWSCTRIEELTLSALQKGFRKELANGELVFRPINVDESKNGHYIDDYKLKTRSVIVSKISGGREITWKNLLMVWNYLGDEKAFIDYVQGEVRKIVNKKLIQVNE